MKKNFPIITDEWTVTQEVESNYDFDSVQREKEIRDILSLATELNERIKKVYSSQAQNQLSLVAWDIWRESELFTQSQKFAYRKLKEAEIYFKSVLESLQKALEHEQNR